MVKFIRSGHSYRAVLTPALLTLAAIAAACGPASAADRVAPTAETADGFAIGRFDMSLTYANREADACLAVAENVAAGACLDLLVMASDSAEGFERTSGDIGGMTEEFAKKLLKYADAAIDVRPGDLLSAHRAMGLTLTNRGKLVDGEGHLREWLSIATKHWSQSTPAERKKLAADPSFRRGFSTLAFNLAQQGRYQPAAAYLRLCEALVLFAGPAAKQDSRELTELALTASLIDENPGLNPRWITAEQYIARAERAAASEEFPRTERLADVKATILVRRGKFAEALTQFDQRERAGDMSKVIINLARAQALSSQGRWGEAEVMLERVEPRLRDLPEDSGQKVEYLTARGLLALRDPDASEQALQLLQQATAGAVLRANQTSDPVEASRYLRQYSPAFEGLMSAHWLTGPAVGRVETSKQEAAFIAGQWAASSETAVSLAKTAAQSQSSNRGEVAQLERERDELIDSQNAFDLEIERRLLDGTTPLSGAAGDASKIHLRLARIAQQIAVADPSYAELTRPQPLNRAQVQALLNPDEALLFIVPTEGATNIFALTHDQMAWSQARGLSESRLAAMVGTLRNQIQSDLDGGSRGLERTEERTGSFDPALANTLYRALIRPVEQVLASARTVMVVGSGPMTALPMSLLVTQMPEGPAEPTYLVDRFAFATLPSVSTLEMQRCLRPNAQRHSGCAAGVVRAPQERRPDGPLLAAVGAPTLRGAPRLNRGATGFAAAFKGSLADTEYLRGLPYLPGTREEIQRVSERFTNRPSVIRLGDDARESFLKTSSDVSNAKYILLSTHGLLAAEAGLSGEPGLVFTPPAQDQATAEDDGLLTASEAAAMHLNADFVVLSACNTGGPDGRAGAEGLSGLTRAFLYAGARSLLVSHWSVNDQASARLIGDTFTNTEELPNRAAALQAAAIAVKSDVRWKSPAFWAPFVLVGVPD